MNLWQEFKRGLKPLVVEEWVDLFIYRPLGFLVALPLYYTSVIPNAVTWMSALAGVAGAVFIYLGTYNALVIGAWLYAFSNVLDCTDGQLARMKQHFSRYGRIYDGVADYIVGLAIFVAIGLSWRPEGYDLVGWWLLVYFGGIYSTVFQGMHLNYVRQSYLKMIEHSFNEGAVHRGVKKKKSPLRKIFYIPFYWLYRLYLSQERGVRLRVRIPINLTSEELASPGLRTVLILWTFTGKGTHVTLLTIFMLLGRPEDYLWFTLIPGNLWVMAVWFGHKRVLQTLTHASETSRT